MKTPRQEEINGSSYRAVRHEGRQIGSFIEDVDNRHRLHLALDDRSSPQFEGGMQRPSPSPWRWVFKGEIYRDETRAGR
jgi:hypothetical protein